MCSSAYQKKLYYCGANWNTLKSINTINQINYSNNGDNTSVKNKKVQLFKKLFI